ncbi:MAG: flavodoxin family protein [Deltaproteobacteria bacterium]|nr:flavodoxin family protein [Deltaproteobacteria bacterium]
MPKSKGGKHTVNILVINGSARAEGTTTALARSFMDGARSHGAAAEMVMLRDLSMAHCANCLQCYAHQGQGPAPCSIQDDMDDIVARVAAADGLLLASPVHSGFVSGLVTMFCERLVWRVLRPSSRPFLGGMGMVSRIDDKVRAVGAILSAGGMPERMRRFCDDGTPWLKGNVPLMVHGQWVGDLYAGACLQRLPENEKDWRRVYFLRRLGTDQVQAAGNLGIRMVRAIRSGRLKPTTMERLIPGPVRWVIERFNAFSPPLRIAR